MFHPPADFIGEKGLNTKAMVTYKRPAIIGQTLTNISTLF